MSHTRCPNCDADLTKEGAISYLSGDTLNCHLEDEDGQIALVRDGDSEGECDSTYTCTNCGSQDIFFDINEVWG